MKSLIDDEIDYVIYDEFFYEDYLLALYHEMLYLEDS